MKRFQIAFNMVNAQGVGLFQNVEAYGINRETDTVVALLGADRGVAARITFSSGIIEIREVAMKEI